MGVGGMMRIRLNGQEISISAPCTLQEFINKHIDTDGAYALALNRSFVAKVNYAQVILQEQDQIDTIFPMQGG
jgi:thiamine biosynthesis protein ThiS